MNERIDLNGDWLLHMDDGQRGNPKFAEAVDLEPSLFWPARVPGCVHTDLMRAGVIKDPALDLNSLDARWVEECRWHYRREFELAASALTSRAWLRFECLDLAAKVLLNGEEIATHSNFFRPLQVEVTGKLKAGKNLLVVHLESGLWSVGDKPAQGWSMNPDQALSKRHWLRKPQFEFNWDWATRLINVGIQGAVSLELSSAPVRLESVAFRAELDASLQKGEAHARVHLTGPLSGEAAATLVLSLPGSNAKPQRLDVVVKPGANEFELVLPLEKPQLWWPVGQGGQALYEAELSLEQAGEKASTRRKKLGFRHVRVEQGPHPEKGSYFHFEVNGRKVFCKGANFVPADLLLSRVDAARQHALIDRALDLNFNFLRVWGGGVYESDAFYERCDEKGMLVWQDFIYACGRYPMIDQPFHEDALAEARYQIERLAGHPSLLAWCGNNENEVGTWEWGFDKGTVHPDYAFYHMDLPRLIEKLDPQRHYQPSSPISPGRLKPNADEAGDQHPWSVGFANPDFRDYRKMISRFPNEGGVLGPCALPTILAGLPEGQRQIGSFAWRHHDNSVNSWAWGGAQFERAGGHGDQLTDVWLGKPMKTLSIEDYCYWAGLVQGEALREYADNFRRRMFDSGSAVFWMFNDSWPCVRSWTVVDYYLRRTPSYYPVKRAMAPVLVIVVEEGEEVVVIAANDTPQELRASLRFGVMSLDGKYPLDQRSDAVLAPSSRTRLASFKRSQWTDPKNQVAFALLEKDGALLARNRLILPFFKEMTWPKAQVKVTLKNGKAIFESGTFAWGVCLDLDGEVDLADNFFDVWPGMPYELEWKLSQAPKVLRLGNLS